MKISIIVPVYNLEKFILNCMNSIFSQNVAEDLYEVIFIDDGSTDNTVKIISENMRSNCRIISQENARQGAARNNGVRNAHGEFVWFVDGDDVITPGSLEKIINIISQNKVDILFYPIKRTTDFSSIQHNTKNYNLKSYTGLEYLSLRSLTLGPIYVFNREFLLKHNLFFMEKVLFEDSEFMPKVCFFAKNIVETNFVPYLALIRENSTTQTFTKIHVENLIIVLSKMINFAQKHKNSKAYHDLCFYCSLVFNTLRMRYSKLSKQGKHNITLSTQMKKDIIACLMNSRNLKYVAEGLALIFLFNLIFK